MSYIGIGDYELDIQRGNLGSKFIVNKFGLNTDVDSASAEDIWDGGGVWAPPTTARTHDIKSTDTNDTNTAGTGARTVHVYGLDGSYALADETVNLNGTTNVATSNTYTMIHRMIVETTGSGGSNAGTITATAQTDATVTAQIAIGNNQTLMAIYQIPATRTGYIRRVYAAINKASAAGTNVDVRLLVKPDGQCWQVKQVWGLLDDGSSYLQRDIYGGITIDAKTLVKIQASSGSDNASISAGFDIVVD